jgi:hypothetical protein
MRTDIKVTYTRSFDLRPLVQIDGGVFCDVIRTPAEIREMAALLLKVADAAEARPIIGRHWMPGRVVLNSVGDEVTV